jgi:dihydrodipicolinate synthase/N-acetylneuraminate lyase
LKKDVERALSTGMNGLCIGGTYGEFATMSPPKQLDCIERVASIVGDRVRLLFCTADSDPRIVRELTVAASQLCPVPMVMPTYVSEIIRRQIVEFLSKALH